MGCLYFKASVLCRAHMSTETCRSSWTDKTTSQRHQWQSWKTQTRSFQDKEDWSIGLRTKGGVKGGGAESAEHERSCHCHAAPEGVCLAPTCTLPERAVEEVAPCPLLTRVIKPRNQTVVHPVWACSHTVHPYIEILSLFPTRPLLETVK